MKQEDVEEDEMPIDALSEDPEICEVETAIESVAKIAKTKQENPDKPKKKWKLAIFWTTLILVSLGAIVFTMLNDFLGTSVVANDTIAGQLRQNWWWLILAVLALIVGLLCRSMIYAAMIYLFTGKTRPKLSMSVTLVGTFYDKVTPLGTGGQAFQIYHLQKQNLPEGAAIAVPVMEYIIGRIAFVMLSITAIILNALNVFGTEVSIVIGIYIMAIIGVVLNLCLPFLLFVSLFSKRACRKITKFVVRVAKFFRLTKSPSRMYTNIMTKLEANISCMKLVLRRKWLLLWVMVCSIGAALAFASIGYFVIKAFGFTTEHGWGWGEIVVINLLIMNAVSFFPTPGGAGMADLSFYLVYSSYLAPFALGAGAIATLIWRLISYYSLVLIGFIHVMVIARKKRRLNHARKEI